MQVRQSRQLLLIAFLSSASIAMWVCVFLPEDEYHSDQRMALPDALLSPRILTWFRLPIVSVRTERIVGFLHPRVNRRGIVTSIPPIVALIRIWLARLRGFEPFVHTLGHFCTRAASSRSFGTSRDRRRRMVLLKGCLSTWCSRLTEPLHSRRLSIMRAVSILP